MKHLIRAYNEDDLDEIIELSLLAWEPVFHSFFKILGSQIYDMLYPDWQKSQREGVELVCRDHERYHTLVAQCEEKVVGFLTYELTVDDKKRGEVVLLAVHPEYQNRGLGTELNLMALENLKEAGVELAVVETGGDESHSPARSCYEKAGYTALPIVRYFKNLGNSNPPGELLDAVSAIDQANSTPKQVLVEE